MKHIIGRWWYFFGKIDERPLLFKRPNLVIGLFIFAVNTFILSTMIFKDDITPSARILFGLIAVVWQGLYLIRNYILADNDIKAREELGEKVSIKLFNTELNG